jgi:hypothetical protein
MPMSFAGTLLANQVRAATGKAGIGGVVGGVAFNMLLRRAPKSAMLLGGAFLAYQLYKAGQVARAERDSGHMLKIPAAKALPEPVPTRSRRTVRAA